MQKSGSDLIIDYIDELSRGRSRIDSIITALTDREFQGLSSTVLSAVVLSRDPPTVPQIGRSLGYPRQTVQRHVEALAERGLIASIDNPDHKTARRLVPTPQGQALYDRSNSASRAWAAGFAKDFDQRDLEVMVTTMRAIRHKLEEATRDRDATQADDEQG